MADVIAVAPTPKVSENVQRALWLITVMKRNVIFYGAAGMGKSHALLLELIPALASAGLKVACTASTGCAGATFSQAGNGLRGSTIHHWAGVGQAKESLDILCKKAKYKFEVARRVKSTDVLVIEEVSMISAELWDKLDAVLRILRGEKKEVFGGLRLVICGDFMQLPPVKANWVFESVMYKACHFMPVKFSQPWRFLGDERFFELLTRVRYGIRDPEDEALLRSRLLFPKQPTKLNQPIEEYLAVRPSVLFPLKDPAREMNLEELSKLPGMQMSYYSIDWMSDVPLTNLSAPAPPNRVAKGGVPETYLKMLENAIPGTIALKVGAQVMLKTNLSVEEGFVNGTRAVVMDMEENYVTIKTSGGVIKRIGRRAWSVGSDPDKDIAVRSQIPLILAWGLTIHASQGCTLDEVECDIGRGVFEAGQAYVALSRSRSLNGLILRDFRPESIYCNEKAKKYVQSLDDQL